MSVKPAILGATGTLQISFSVYEDAPKKVNISDLSLLLVQPDGATIPAKFHQINSVLGLTLPKDIPNLVFQPGRYSTLLLLKGIDQNVSATFEVLSYPPYISSLFSFLIKDGQTLTIGLIISLTTVIYQYLTSKNDERRRIVKDKADWMRDKGSEYSRLYSACSSVHEYFQARRIGNNYQVSFNNLNEYKAKRLFYDIIDFYRSYIHFYESGIDYYFDDYRSEDFLDNVWWEIRELYSEILKSNPTQIPLPEREPDYLKTFFKDEKGNDKFFYDLVKDDQFRIYSGYLRNWLTQVGDPAYPNIKKLYSYHYVYSKVLLLKISDALLVSYTDANRVNKQIRIDYEEDYGELSDYIKHLNNRIYETKKSYFELKFNNKDLQDTHWWDLKWRRK